MAISLAASVPDPDAKAFARRHTFGNARCVSREYAEPSADLGSAPQYEPSSTNRDRELEVILPDQTILYSPS
jgi:hypothetical protein